MRIHNRTWVVHHVTPLVMDCMWALDAATSGSLADLCPCSMEVVEDGNRGLEGSMESWSLPVGFLALPSTFGEFSSVFPVS